MYSAEESGSNSGVAVGADCAHMTPSVLRGNHREAQQNTEYVLEPVVSGPTIKRWVLCTADPDCGQRHPRDGLSYEASHRSRWGEYASQTLQPLH